MSAVPGALGVTYGGADCQRAADPEASGDPCSAKNPAEHGHRG